MLKWSSLEFFKRLCLLALLVLPLVACDEEAEEEAAVAAKACPANTTSVALAADGAATSSALADDCPVSIASGTQPDVAGVGAGGGVTVLPIPETPEDPAPESPEPVASEPALEIGVFTIATPDSPTADTTPTVSWGVATNAAKYAVAIALAADCSAPAIAVETTATTYTAETALATGSYHVCVTAIGAAERAAANSGLALSVDQSAPPAPAAPTDVGSVIATSTITFDWAAVSDVGAAGGVTYNVRVGLSSGANDIYTGSVGAATHYELTATNSGQTFYASVQAVDALGNASAFSPVSNGITYETAIFVDFDAPQGHDDGVAAGGTFNIALRPNSPDIGVGGTISLSFANTAAGACSGGTTIATGLDASTASYGWNTTGVTAGRYFLCARIAGASGDDETWSDAIFVTTACTWTGKTSDDWSAAGNWVGCAGAAPVAASAVLVPGGMATEPRVVSGVKEIDHFEIGTGGGSVTVAAGATLLIKDASASSQAIRSDLTIKGDTSSCTTCVVKMADLHDLYVAGAKLTLGDGIALALDSNSRVVIKDRSGVAGQLATVTANVDASKWPRITASQGGGFIDGILFVGAAAAKSVADLDGLRVENVDVTAAVGVHFEDHYRVAKFDKVVIDHYGSNPTPSDNAQIEIENCANGVFTDSTWTDVVFQDFAMVNVTVTGCNAAGVVTIEGSGNGFGDAAEVDANGSVNWGAGGAARTCLWLGDQNPGGWENVANWSNCPGDEGPGPNDWIDVDVAGGVLTIDANRYVRGFKPFGGGSGEVVVSPLTSLTLLDRAAFQSQTKISGSSASCTTCYLRHYERNTGLFITGELDLGAGLSFALDATMYVGNGTSDAFFFGDSAAGGATSSQWPVLTSNQAPSWGGIVVEGGSASGARIDFDGMRLENVVMSDTADRVIELKEDAQIDGFDNVVMNPAASASVAGTYVAFADCTGSNVANADATWANVSFADGIGAGGHNVSLHASCTGADFPVTSVTGTGTGNGEAGDLDPNDRVSWP